MSAPAASKRNNKCFVPNCRSGYKSEKGKFSLFSAPAGDDSLLEAWKKNIPREDREFTSRDVVCEKHFHPSDIIREWKSGSITLPYIRPKLKKGAIPTIFPNCPSYLTKKVCKRRILERSKVPEKKRKFNLPQPIDIFSEEQEITSAGHDVFSNLYDEIPFKLPPSCNISKCTENNTKFLIFSRTVIYNGKPYVRHICIREDMQMKFYSNYLEIKLDQVIQDHFVNLSCLEETVNTFMSSNICVGGPDGSSYNVKTSKISKLDHATGRWRHNSCLLLLRDKQLCCTNCKYLYKVFNSLKNYNGKDQQHNIKLIKKSSIEKKSLMQKNRRLLSRLKIVKDKVLKMKTEFSEMKQDIFDKKISNLPKNQKDVVLECLNLSKYKSTKGRRYTTNWIMSCMLLYMKSSSTYEYLRKNEILPLCDISTVRRYLRNVNVQCGLDDNFFLALKRKLSGKSQHQKDGLLLFDEMQVKSSITVNPNTLKLDGFTDFGLKSTGKGKRELVDHALVFMFSSLHDSYVQPIAVYGVKGATKGDILAQLLMKVVMEVTKAGGNIRGIICDGATTNRKMWTLFGISGQRGNVINSFKNPYNDKEVFVFSDTPHLFKCIRNRMFNQPHLITPFGKISWSYYERLYNLDTEHPGNVRVCPKISFDHINPTNFLKMRVKLATQIFSKSVADGLLFYHNHCPDSVDDGVYPTIKFTNFMNSLFDALNRKCHVDGIYKDSKDFEVLQQGLNFLNEWESLKINDKEMLTNNTADGLRVTITSTIQLSEVLLNEGYKYVATAKINQDPLEVV